MVWCTVRARECLSATLLQVQLPTSLSCLKQSTRREVSLKSKINYQNRDSTTGADSVDGVSNMQMRRNCLIRESQAICKSTTKDQPQMKLHEIRIDKVKCQSKVMITSQLNNRFLGSKRKIGRNRTQVSQRIFNLTTSIYRFSSIIRQATKSTSWHRAKEQLWAFTFATAHTNLTIACTVAIDGKREQQGHSVFREGVDKKWAGEPIESDRRREDLESANQLKQQTLSKCERSRATNQHD